MFTNNQNFTLTVITGVCLAIVSATAAQASDGFYDSLSSGREYGSWEPSRGTQPNYEGLRRPALSERGFTGGTASPGLLPGSPCIPSREGDYQTMPYRDELHPAMPNRDVPRSGVPWQTLPPRRDDPAWYRDLAQDRRNRPDIEREFGQPRDFNRSRDPLLDLFDSGAPSFLSDDFSREYRPTQGMSRFERPGYGHQGSVGGDRDRWNRGSNDRLDEKFPRSNPGSWPLEGGGRNLEFNGREFEFDLNDLRKLPELTPINYQPVLPLPVPSGSTSGNGSAGSPFYP